MIYLLDVGEDGSDAVWVGGVIIASRHFEHRLDCREVLLTLLQLPWQNLGGITDIFWFS
jgi:hypothetical protein